MDGAVEVAHFTTEEVDPLGRRRRTGEDGPLDLLDVPLEAFDNRRVVVDDLVEDRPQHRVGACPQEILVLLEPKAGGVELACNSLAHRDHEPRSEEDADLAELDLLALVHVVRSSQDDEAHVVVALELRPQVEGLRVLDSELVEVEALLNLLELLGLRLEHPEPDEPAARAAGGGLLERDGTGVLALPVQVVRAIDDHAPLRSSGAPPTLFRHGSAPMRHAYTGPSTGR
jgi:hypothetical protein